MRVLKHLMTGFIEPHARMILLAQHSWCRNEKNQLIGDFYKLFEILLFHDRSENPIECHISWTQKCVTVCAKAVTSSSSQCVVDGRRAYTHGATDSAYTFGNMHIHTTGSTPSIYCCVYITCWWGTLAYPPSEHELVGRRTAGAFQHRQRPTD